MHDPCRCRLVAKLRLYITVFPQYHLGVAESEGVNKNVEGEAVAAEVVYQVVGATGSHTVFCERDQVVHCTRVTQHIALSPSDISGGGGKREGRACTTQNHTEGRTTGRG
jgi:hypothetical protein